MVGNERTERTGRRVVVAGGTDGVGEGVVRRHLAAGAQVLVPTRSLQRAEEFRAVLGEAATDGLQLVVHDYTTFEGAERLVAEARSRLGGVDEVVASVGGWWSGRRLWEVDDADWTIAFVGLATTHLALARAFVPLLPPFGTYTVVVGESATVPVPSSGLVSMQQSALLMMRDVLQAELDGGRRVFALVLGPVRTRHVSDEAGWVTSDQIGEVAVALAATPTFSGRAVGLHDAAAAAEALQTIASTR